MIGRLLREPLLHFLVLGAALFAASASIRRAAPDTTEIVVTTDAARAIEAQFRASWQRSPGAAEMQALIDNYIRDEVLYREGLALGLDRDDPVIRNRIRQKMEVFGEESLTVEPTDAELAAYLAAHKEQFEIPAAITFEQVYFDPSRHGGNINTVVTDALAGVSRGQSHAGMGDRTMLAARMDRALPPEISTKFGRDFARAVAALPVGGWHGPVTSSFGLHLVRVSWRGDARMPALADVRDAVAREWTRARTVEVRKQFYEALRGRYSVRIEPLAPDARSGGR